MTAAELEGRLTARLEDVAPLLGMGRSAAYEAAKRGQIPTLRLGRRLVVPVPALMAMLGAEPKTGGEVVAVDCQE